MKKELLVTILLCFMFFAVTVHAQTETIIYPAFDAYWNDSDGDGVFDTEGNLTGTDLNVAYDPMNQTNCYRAALEFDLSPLGLTEGTVIEKAEFYLHWAGFNNPQNTYVFILAYQGDGLCTSQDFKPSPVIDSWSFTGNEVINGILKNIDVTDFIQLLVDNSKDYAGLTLYSESIEYSMLNLSSKESQQQDFRPMLKITYSYIPPSEPNIEETIDFFDQAVEDGTLEGSGGGRRGRVKLLRMESYLTIASYFIERDRINFACFELRRAFLGCDGERAELVEGEGAEDLSQMIYDLAVSIDCRWAAD